LCAKRTHWLTDGKGYTGLGVWKLPLPLTLPGTLLPIAPLPLPHPPLPLSPLPFTPFQIYLAV